MKALVLHDKGQPLVPEERAEPTASGEEAIVKVYAAALNHRDVWIQKGRYAGLVYPAIPGSDGAGVVAATGSNSHAHWKGKDVIINPTLNWGASEAHPDMPHFRILGMPDPGTFAQYVKVPVSCLAEKPAHLSFEAAAALPLAGLTAFRALFTRARLKTGEKILITGTGGGVALFALQFAVASGAKVWVSSGSDEKIAAAVKLGARAGVNYRNSKWMEQLQEQAGEFDVIIDGTAGDSVNQLFNLACPGGRVVFYGSTMGNPSSAEIRRIFWKQLNVLGTTMGSAADFQAMTAFVSKQQIQPIIDKIFPFLEGEKAMRRMDEALQFGKIVLKIV